MQERSLLQEKLHLANSIELPFVCSTCQNLAIVNNPNFFFRDHNNGKRECNTCCLAELKRLRSINKI